jgi:NADH-quinone oxidoreductase subunit G/NADP-reducing hydrogenase subunit HndD
MCIVEAKGKPGLIPACSYPAEEGMEIETRSPRVLNSRRTIMELLLASHPFDCLTCVRSGGCELQSLAAEYNIAAVPFKGKTRHHYTDFSSPSIVRNPDKCILCGRCVRVCEEQMMAKAIGFRSRGEKRSIGTPFDVRSEVCRLCGACMYVCPSCQLRCTYTEPDKAVCGGCANLSPPCIEKEEFDDMMCYMAPCVACEIKKD